MCAIAGIHQCQGSNWLARGKIKADYAFEIESTSETGGGNYHGTWIVGVTAQLDDDAQIAGIDMDFLYQNGGSAGSSDELSGRWPSGASDPEPIKDGKGFAYIATMSRQFQAKNVEESLEKTIERGKCVALGLSASDGPDGLATDTDVTITATFTYTSAEKTDERGTVGFEARSRRGVGKEDMTLTTGERMVGTWAMDNDSGTSVVGPVAAEAVAAQAGADMKATGGPIITTFKKGGTFEFTFNGFTQLITVPHGKMTVVYGGKDTGT